MQNRHKATPHSGTGYRYFHNTAAALGMELILSFLALLLTCADLLVRTIFFVVSRTATLLYQLCCAILLMSLFIIAYLIGMGLYLALGPGISTNLS